MSLAEKFAADACFYILKELARQTDLRLSEVMIERVLDNYAITRDRPWIRTRLLDMERWGAIETSSLGTVLVAHLLPAGRAHLDERAVIAGISRPWEAA